MHICNSQYNNEIENGRNFFSGFSLMKNVEWIKNTEYLIALIVFQWLLIHQIKITFEQKNENIKIMEECINVTIKINYEFKSH